MLPLALTSTAGMIRRMGGKRWQALHRLIYVAAVAGVLHYWWLVKADVSRPQVYARRRAVCCWRSGCVVRFRTAAPGTESRCQASKRAWRS